MNSRSPSSSVNNTPMSQRRRSAAPNYSLRYLSMILTGIVGGFSTFVIYDRMYHAMEIEQMLVLSVETMNVQAGGRGEGNSVFDQVVQQAAEQQKDKQQRIAEGEEEPKRNKLIRKAVREVKEGAKKIEEAAVKNIEGVIQEPETGEEQETEEMQQQQLKRKEKKEERKKLTTTGPKEPIKQVQVKPSDVVRSLEDLEGDERYKVYFLNITQVTKKDSFSASWLQSKKDFLDMKLEFVQICEDASFKAWNTRLDKLRMPMDYFDWSVEHLSKWWKLLDYSNNEIVYSSVYNKLQAYIRAGGADYPTPSSPPVLGETVVTIAFQPYGVGKSYAKLKLPVERAYNLTIVSLAATIESVRRAEMGRVVVVGSQEELHRKYAQDAIQYLHDNLKVDSPDANSNKEQMVGHLEVAYVTATPEMTRTKHLARNMPRGALEGARKAFLLADQEERSEQDNQLLSAWFGTGHDPKHWQYLYLTEPDSILTTRSSALSQVKDEIDLRGGIVSPIRLQPIPHESDVRGLRYKDSYLQEADGFETILELDHYADSHDVCCDEHMGHDWRPGKMPGDECGHKKWFLCGFEQKVKTEDPHRRLKPYQLFRLTKGTGLTTIAGNLFGRRCFAGQSAVCRPPHVH